MLALVFCLLLLFASGSWAQSPCASNPCVNGGSCVERTYGTGPVYYTCACPANYVGTYCQTRGLLLFSIASGTSYNDWSNGPAIGGIRAADRQCQKTADKSAKLISGGSPQLFPVYTLANRTFVAILCTSYMNASSHISHGPIPYVDACGSSYPGYKVVANDYDDLISGNGHVPRAGICDETGRDVAYDYESITLSATTYKGFVLTDPLQTCGDWTNSSTGGTQEFDRGVVVSDVYYSGGGRGWVQFGARYTCDSVAPASAIITLHCIEQLACPENETAAGTDHCEPDYCITQPCDPLVDCVHYYHGRWCSACPAGYSGSGYSQCTEIDECVSMPCQNGATCVNQINAFRCTCPPGFTGSLCQTVYPDACLSTPCQNDGVCNSFVDGTFNCTCFNGTYGNMCQYMDACASVPGPCRPPSVCSHDANRGGYNCTMPPYCPSSGAYSSPFSTRYFQIDRPSFNLSGEASWTISMWFRNSLIGTGLFLTAGTGQGPCNQLQYGFPSSSAAYQLNAGTVAACPGGVVQTGSSWLNGHVHVGQWNFYSASYDGSTSVATLYYNGDKYVSKKLTTPFTAPTQYVKFGTYTYAALGELWIYQSLPDVFLQMTQGIVQVSPPPFLYVDWNTTVIWNGVNPNLGYACGNYTQLDVSPSQNNVTFVRGTSLIGGSCFRCKTCDELQCQHGAVCYAVPSSSGGFNRCNCTGTFYTGERCDVPIVIV